MKNFQQKRGWRHIIQSRIVLGILGVLILFFAWNVFNLWNKMRETSRNKKMVEEKISNLKIQKEKLSSDINNLNTQDGKEKFIRENYGWAKEGEKLIVVVDDKTPPPASKDESSSGFFYFLKNLFK